MVAMVSLSVQVCLGAGFLEVPRGLMSSGKPSVRGP